MQTKKISLTEALINTFTGMFFNYLINAYILPIYGIKISLQQNFLMIITFVVFATLKTYLIRRFFNNFNISKIKK